MLNKTSFENILRLGKIGFSNTEQALCDINEVLSITDMLLTVTPTENFQRCCMPTSELRDNLVRNTTKKSKSYSVTRVVK